MKKSKKKIKKSAFIIIVIVLLLIGIFAVYLILNKNTKDKKNKEPKENNEIIITFKDIDSLEINDKVTNVSIIDKISNGTLKTKEELIDTSVLGTISIVFEVLDNNSNSHEYKKELMVVDTTPPKITYNAKLTTEEGIQINLLDNVSAQDNSKEEVIVTVEGEYNFNKSGEYKIMYVAKDSSGNETKEEAVLTVTAKKIVDNPVQKPEPQPSDGTFTTSKGFKGVIKNGITYIDGYLIANKTYSLPSTYNPGLSKETKDAFDKMAAAASLDGIKIWCQSGFRSYTTQQNIYNRYVAANGKELADTFSARPGYSEHQSGLACDINDVINSTFDNTPEAKWAAANAYKYGLILRYPKNKTNETGYKYESWHFRYVGVELATKLYNNGDWITLEDYFGITSEYKD